VREGATKEHDTLPRRFSKEPLKGGPCEGRAVDLEQLKKEYYVVRGWDAHGTPTKEKLKELAIDGD
jgi:aldehyde:ferredoxin oxidoreductase